VEAGRAWQRNCKKMTARELEAQFAIRYVQVIDVRAPQNGKRGY